jgi:hypothetical protein
MLSVVPLLAGSLARVARLDAGPQLVVDLAEPAQLVIARGVAAEDLARRCRVERTQEGVGSV